MMAYHIASGFAISITTGGEGEGQSEAVCVHPGAEPGAVVAADDAAVQSGRASAFSNGLSRVAGIEKARRRERQQKLRQIKMLKNNGNSTKSEI